MSIIYKTKEGVEVYSNKNSLHDVEYIMYGLYTGVKWQCVEFARRFLIQVKGVTFDSIPNAFQIFDLPYFKNLIGIKIPINKYKNGSYYPPKKYSLLIWKSNTENKSGHVAVVTNIGLDWIEITQQNEDIPVRILHLELYYGYPIYVIREPNLLGWINF